MFSAEGVDSCRAGGNVLRTWNGVLLPLRSRFNVLSVDGAPQTLAQAIDEFAVLLRQIVEEAVDRFDDDAPLRETSDSAERVEARLELVRNTDAQLRIVLDL